jgi:hypothetical protein
MTKFVNLQLTLPGARVHFSGIPPVLMPVKTILPGTGAMTITHS